MQPHRQRRLQSCSPLSRWLVGLLATNLLACSLGDRASPGSDGPGSLSVALVAQANGHTYRLRQATFSISGPTVAVLDSEAQPDAGALTASLNPGGYTVSLADAWFLERLDADAFVRVAATLTSANPAAFTIAAGASTPVSFRFATDGTIVTMVTVGTVSITTEVTETAPDAGAAVSCQTPTRACYTGPAGTAGVGTCSAGVQACVGNDFGPCTAESLPGAEVCNGLDDDCDGSVDEGC
jgi:hypothetical protein